MDLIYADTNGRELGVIDDFELDIAFGSDENNFSLQVSMDAHCCEAGYYIYIDGTEYGGIVDKIEPDTAADTVTYEGRTWHGIINGKVIEPEEGQDYRIVDGEANAVLAELVELLDLGDLFSVSSETSNVTINNYQFARYVAGYVGILDMLLKNDGKLKFTHTDGKVVLSAVPLCDYSKDEEWDSSQMDFSIVKNYRPTNHLICLGSGNLSERKVIHLFTDANGGVQPYTTAEVPLSDADYITSKENQQLFGIEEVSETYDYGNAQQTQNYVLLTEQPANWRRSYTNYYYKDNDEFKALEQSYDDAYTVLTEQPADWAKKYASYYIKSSGKYKSVEGVETAAYSKQKKKPKDWKKNYGNYFYHWSDGLTEEYKKVSGVTKYKYLAQTMKPSDWATTYKDYYEKVPTIKYVYEVREMLSDGVWKKHTEIVDSTDDVKDTGVKRYIFIRADVIGYEYEKLSTKKAPKWIAKRYYTKKSYTVTPKWKENYYYDEVTTTVAPEWKESTYYTTTSVENIPVWKRGTYYELRIDNYADLVSNGLAKLAESYDCDEININLDATQEYDINDIVGATENKTGISVFQPITKKIIKFKNNLETIEYTIG